MYGLEPRDGRNGDNVSGHGMVQDMKRKMQGSLVALVVAVSAVTCLATDPWPAESYTQAVALTAVDPGLNTVNWSGAFWNPTTRTLWLACNSGYFWALVEDGTGSFMVATNAGGTAAKWTPGGDLEAICQADFTQEVAYLMDENGWIREYDVSDYGVVAENRNWDIRAQCPEVSGLFGPEGITFVPDEWLARQGFRHTNGNLYVSTNGMDGLMFVGHQDGGYVHVFDLDPAGTQYGYVGRYETSRPETADLEFDRSTGKLYIWHNYGNNYLEVAELNSYVNGSERRLRQLVEYAGPRSGNLEGFALAPTQETNNWCFITDDDNLYTQAVAWYREFEPSEDTDADALLDGWELWYFGTTTQTTGSADSDLDRMDNADECIAGTDPTNASSIFSLVETSTETNVFILNWSSASGRVYAIRQADTPGNIFTQVVESGIPATPSINGSTVDVSAIPSGAYYRISVTVP